MVVMKSGSAGKKVAAVQDSLKALGFDPGKADGKFGPRTKAAVIEFQKSRKLVADGIVGPKTLAALEWQTETKNPVAELVPSSTPQTRKSGGSLQKGKTPLLPSPELVTKMFRNAFQEHRRESPLCLECDGRGEPC
jgi:peptidoglycan hydrolase-like protein with peptidoglycan-binding domain